MQRYNAMLRPRQDVMPVKMTAIDASQPANVRAPYHRLLLDEGVTSGLRHALLVFPERVLLTGLTLTDIPTVAAALSTDMALTDSMNTMGGLSKHASVRSAGGVHFVVCAHTRRDKRCDECGPRLQQWLREATESLVDRVPGGVHVWAGSHVGGHRFAGNLVAFPHGEWFGLVNDPDNAAAIARYALSNGEEAMESLPMDHLDPPLREEARRAWNKVVQQQHAYAAGMMQGSIQRFPNLWRGRLGLTPTEQEAVSKAFAWDAMAGDADGSGDDRSQDEDSD